MAVLREPARLAQIRARLRPHPTVPVLNLDPVTQRVLTAHAVALVGTLLVLLADPGTQRVTTLLGLGIFVGVSALRTVHVHRHLVASTLLLDAVGTAVFMAGTGAPSSAYFFLALAGVWWAAHVPRRHSGALWAGGFAAAYIPLVVPGAIADAMLVHAMEDVSVVVITAVLSDWFVRVDARAIALSDALAAAPAGAEKLAIREGLNRALGPMEIPLDVLVAASRAGLTVIQAELLAYLALGLTNQEIADATKVSVPTVRYRLTRLYRALGVRGRNEAAERARAIGLPGAWDVS